MIEFKGELSQKSQKHILRKEKDTAMNAGFGAGLLVINLAAIGMGTTSGSTTRQRRSFRNDDSTFRRRHQ